MLIIRHGQDEPNFRGGWSEKGLTPLGIFQSYKLSNYLLSIGYNNSKIISSDLPRAKETALILSKHLNSDLKLSKNWREVNSGLLSGMNKDESDIIYPNMYLEKLSIDEKYPEGESPREFYNRVVHAFNKLVLKINNCEKTILVTHGGTIMVLFHYLKGLDWINDRKYIKVEKCSINYVEYENSKWQIIRENHYNY